MSVPLVDYFELLNNLRNDLAANLVRRGVEASAEESLQILIPKVLYISEGNPYIGWFEGTLVLTHIKNGEYDVFLYDQPASFKNALSITGYFKMAQAVLTITGIGITDLIIDAPGWTINKESDSSATLTMNTEEIRNSILMQDFLDAITFKSISDAHIEISFKAIEQDTQTEYTIEGTTSIDIQKNSWAHIEDTYLLWNSTEEKTWDQLESLS